MIVKICGVTRESDARACAEAGADMIGINFWPKSKRFARSDVASVVARAAREVNPDIAIVGVFVNPSARDLEAADSAATLDWIQFHGDEPVETIASAAPRGFKAIRVGSAADVATALSYPGSWLLLDAPSADYGGGGETFAWKHVEAMASSGRQWLLAGGLSPDNVARALQTANPSGVDVASGVEVSPGIKDPGKIIDFVKTAKEHGNR